MKTIYGEIPESMVDEFCEVAGHDFLDGEEIIEKDEVEYWQLVNPSSIRNDTKWQKKLGWLPIRDFNFQYALMKTPTKGKNGWNYDIQGAIKYAKEKMFLDGKPIYLPEVLADKADPFRDKDTKPSKSYNKILLEEEERFKNL